jgi:hypothetical protein
MNGHEIYDELIKILLKKANGFYYTEEQEDYEKAQNKSKSTEQIYKNMSFFENYDTVETQTNQTDDKIGLQNEIRNNSQNLILVKKKITKHYIPPDMLAVKILFETLKEKVNEDDINTLSDEDLIKLKDKLLGELLNEN